MNSAIETSIDGSWLENEVPDVQIVITRIRNLIERRIGLDLRLFIAKV